MKGNTPNPENDPSRFRTNVAGTEEDPFYYLSDVAYLMAIKS